MCKYHYLNQFYVLEFFKILLQAKVKLVCINVLVCGMFLLVFQRLSIEILP